MFRSHSFWLSENPCLPLLKEFGPAEVGVSLPMFFIRIFASGGISSGSLSSSSLKIAATESVFGARVGVGSLGLFAPSLMDIAGGFFAICVPMANPNLDILAGAGFVVKSSASSSAARFSTLRLELSPPLLEETVLVFTGFSASSSGPGEVETTYQDELFLLSGLMGAATS